MVSASRRSAKNSELAACVSRVLKTVLKRGDRVTLGLSGGIDSMVLLDLLARISKRAGWRLSVVHVNHQISAHAAKWAAFCRRVCREYGVPLRVAKVDVARGNSTESAARARRYEVYRQCRTNCIVLAHNQDDQAETVLLRLLRGAGVRGLAAMPVMRADAVRANLQIVRPLLDIPRSAIERYAQERCIAWIEDDSNDDTHYLRNYLRTEILPRVVARVPAYRTTLTRTAALHAEAAGLLDELAGMDLKKDNIKQILSVNLLRRLSAPRAANLLRYFLSLHGVLMPDQAGLKEALRQVLTAKVDANIRINLGTHELRRFNHALHVVRGSMLQRADLCMVWRGQRKLRLPAPYGELGMRRTRGAGIDLQYLTAETVTIRHRQGGERLQPDANRPRRKVKDLLQQAGIPPWWRDVMPFLWCGDKLVWVPGLGIDCRFHARSGTASLQPDWSGVISADLHNRDFGEAINEL